MKSLWGQGNRYLRVNRKSIEVSPGFARFVMIGLIVLTTIVFVAGDVGLWNLWMAQKKMKTLDEEVKRLEIETESLRIKIRELQHDPFAIEKVAREKYGYLRPGDRIYRIITLPTDKESIRILPTSLDTKGSTQ